MTRGQSKGSRWLAGGAEPRKAQLRLLCFPAAGSGASLYRSWAHFLPAAIDVCPVLLPGREAYLSEPAHRRLADLVGAMADDLAELLTEPFAIFGHSYGALAGFELARELRRIGGPQPALLFVSGKPGPMLPPSWPSLHDAPDDELLQKLSQIDGTPLAVLNEPTWMKLMLPTFRADLEALATYVYRPEQPLGCPISAFGGLSDGIATEPDLRAWREVTGGGFRLRMLPGGHFFLVSSREQLLAAIDEDLAPFWEPGGRA
ncbi:alpha/beta fold hydrolase [Sorangium sp. So ce429]